MDLVSFGHDRKDPRYVYALTLVDRWTRYMTMCPLLDTTTKTLRFLGLTDQWQAVLLVLTQTSPDVSRFPTALLTSWSSSAEAQTVG